jgi:hypothetical protein
VPAVVFDDQAWRFRYPELSDSVPAGMAQALFAEAGLYLFPGDGSLVTDEGQRLIILQMIVAHIAQLRSQVGTGLVGRITSASEGSVSVSVAPMSLPGSAEWFGLTAYGITAWGAMAQYRTARYVPGPGAFRRSPGFPGVSPWFGGRGF